MDFVPLYCFRAWFAGVHGTITGGFAFGGSKSSSSSDGRSLCCIAGSQECPQCSGQDSQNKVSDGTWHSLYLGSLKYSTFESLPTSLRNSPLLRWYGSERFQIVAVQRSNALPVCIKICRSNKPPQLQVGKGGVEEGAAEHSQRFRSYLRNNDPMMDRLEAIQVRWFLILSTFVHNNHLIFMSSGKKGNLSTNRHRNTLWVVVTDLFLLKAFYM